MERTYEVDDIGPEIVVETHDAATKTRGVLVIDSSALGAAGGGTRFVPDVAVGEVARLARAMSHKFAIYGFPRGGAKAGVAGRAELTTTQRRAALEAFGRAIAPFLTSRRVVLSGDMGVGPEDLPAIYRGAGVSCPRSGLFERVFEGDPGAFHFTGHGVVVSMRTAWRCLTGRSLAGATVAIEGFGQVGAGVARYAAREGARVVAVSTLHGVLYDPRGLDVDALLARRREQGDACVLGQEGRFERNAAALFVLPVDVMVPGARPFALHEGNAGDVRAALVVSGANDPITARAEAALSARGVVVVPDFVSNAGGVIASWADILDGDAGVAKRANELLIARVTEDVLRAGDAHGSLRAAAVTIATQALRTARRPAPSFEEARDRIRERFRELGVFGVRAA